jgi:hypothetical protein
VRRAGAIVAILLISGALPLAHHSFAAHYFEQQMVTVTGAIVEFDYRTPHAWVKINGRDETGQNQVFSAEWSNPNRLARDGVNKTTLKIGDVVVIAGSPGRNPDDHRLHLKAIQRPDDGWEWPEHRRR